MQQKGAVKKQRLVVENLANCKKEMKGYKKRHTAAGGSLEGVRKNEEKGKRIEAYLQFPRDYWKKKH